MHCLIFLGQYGGIASAMPHIFLAHPKITVPLGSLMCLVGVVLLIFSDGGHDARHFWGFNFTGNCIGSIGAVMLYLSANTSVSRQILFAYADSMAAA
jgi:uncharacterized membrane protein HdeD (DUF308 family)